MRLLFIKIFRDIRQTLGQFFSILIIVFVGCFFFAGMLTGSKIISSSVTDVYADCSIASSEATYMLINDIAIEQIAQTSGVSVANGRNVFYTKAAMNGADESVDATVMTITQDVNTYIIESGTHPKAKECIIDSVYAKAAKINVGDKMTFKIPTIKEMGLKQEEGREVEQRVEYVNIEYTLTVAGTFYSPDIISKINVMDSTASRNDFIMALINYDEIPLVTNDAVIKIPVKAEVAGAVYEHDMIIPFSSITVNLYTGVLAIADESVNTENLFKQFTVESADDLIEILKPENLNVKGAGLFMYKLDFDEFPSVKAFSSTFDPIEKLSGVLPLLFFAVAAIITVVSLAKMVDNQRNQIGIMQAIGISKGGIYFTYIFYALFASVIGGLLGALCGELAIPEIYKSIFNVTFTMPNMPISIRFEYVLAAVVLAAAVACASSFASSFKTLRSVPAQALRDKPPKKTRKTALERWHWAWRHMGFGAKMNYRNMALHAFKILISSVGIIGCMMLMVGMLAMSDRITYALNTSESSINYDLVGSLKSAVNIDELDVDEVFKLDGQNRIQDITFAPNISATLRKGNKSEGVTVIALPSQADILLYPHSRKDCVKVYRANGDKLEMSDNTFALSSYYADRLGVKVGDTISFTAYTADNQNVSAVVTVTDITRQYIDQNVYCSYATMRNIAGNLFVNEFFITVKNVANLDDAVAEIADFEQIRSIHTKTAATAKVRENMNLLYIFVVICTIGAGSLAIAVIYNITAINVSERKREIATLMVLGYKRREISSMIMIENLVITLIGCLIGIPGGYGLLVWLITIARSLGVILPSNLTILPCLVAVVGTFIFSIIATLLLERRMSKISMVEALKSVE